MTSVVTALHVPSGCQVVTTSTYPGPQQDAAMAMAARMVPTNYPLNGTTFGAASKTPVFYSEGAAATGQQRGVVTGKHLLLDSASALSPTTGKASATPVPGTAFATVRLAGWCDGMLAALKAHGVHSVCTGHKPPGMQHLMHGGLSLAMAEMPSWCLPAVRIQAAAN